MRFAVFVALPALLPTVAALLQTVAADDPAPAQQEPVVVTSREHPDQVSLNKGGTLVVKLEAQPGTGFGWKVAKNDSAILAPEGVPVLEPDKTLPGGTEWQIFRFRAAAAGADDLELNYSRPFDPAKPPAKTFRLRVQVR